MTSPLTIERPATLEEQQFSWRMARRRARRCGLRFTRKLPPMDGEQSRECFDRLTSEYWRGLLSKAEMKAEAEAIREASKSYFLRGKVAHMPGKSKSIRLRRSLIERDGYECWLCGEDMPLDDCTIEHLVARSLGGTDDLSNLVLCHEHCNKKLGNLPLADKQQLREFPHDLRP